MSRWAIPLRNRTRRRPWREIKLRVPQCHASKRLRCPVGVPRGREPQGLELPPRAAVDEVNPCFFECLRSPPGPLAPSEAGWPKSQVHAVTNTARRGQLGAAVKGPRLEGNDRSGWSGAGYLRCVEFWAAAVVASIRPPRPTSSGAPPRARHPAKPDAASNGPSPARSSNCWNEGRPQRLNGHPQPPAGGLTDIAASASHVTTWCTTAEGVRLCVESVVGGRHDAGL